MASDTITATITKVLFRKADGGGWSILRTDQGVAKGTVPWDVKPGDRLELDGQWGVSGYSGDREFTFKAARVSIPQDCRALLTYACSITKGLGPAREGQIWEKYGAKWREHRDLNLPGLAASVDFHWQDTLARLEEQATQSQAIAFLLGKGCSLNMAHAAWNLWLVATVPLVTADPYQLAELPHYGFCHIDGDIRRAFGITDNDPRRAEAAVLYILGSRNTDGSTLASIASVAAGLVEVLGEFVEAAPVLAALQARKAIRLLGDSVAIEKEYQWEQTIASRFGVGQ